MTRNGSHRLRATAGKVARGVLLSAVVLTGVVPAPVLAKARPEAEALGKELTPFGAERAGNEAGTIPAWEGGLTPDKAPAGYVRGKHHINPFASDKPLFVITAANLHQYREQLPKGVQALVETYPETFRVPVYQTRRTAAAPQWVYDNIARNARTGKLVNNGNGIEGAVGGVAFPIPKEADGKIDPLKILWNHITRWRGIYIIRNSAQATVQRNGSFSMVASQQDVDLVYYHRDKTPETLDNRLLNYLSVVRSPARLAGGAVLLHDTIDRVAQPRDAWGYNAGQRKIRRAPNLAYDTPVSAADGLIMADDVDMFNGAPDKYEWALLGQREMYIPYNNYRLASPEYKYTTLLQRGHVNADATRWELHRVWVIEGTLKRGQRHTYTKRTYYVDADSWAIVTGDLYDRNGKLYRVPVSFIMNYYEVPCQWTTLDAYHDLLSQRYYVSFLANEEPTSLTFDEQPPRESFFQPQAVRRRGTR